jgi:hypothetical protein
VRRWDPPSRPTHVKGYIVNCYSLFDKQFSFFHYFNNFFLLKQKKKKILNHFYYYSYKYSTITIICQTFTFTVCHYHPIIATQQSSCQWHTCHDRLVIFPWSHYLHLISIGCHCVTIATLPKNYPTGAILQDVRTRLAKLLPRFIFTYFYVNLQ